MLNTTKICTTCNTSKNFSEFYKATKGVHGLTSHCKKCVCDTRLKSKRTKTGLIAVIYNRQKSRSTHRGHPQPTYTMDQLSEWLLGKKKYHKLFKKWKKSGYAKDLIPSVDRKDDYLGYSFNNIQLMTWKENRDKGHSDRRKGVNNKQSRQVLQFSPHLVFISEYPSTAEANRSTTVNQSDISACCLGKRKTAGGFIWKYK